MKYIRLFFFFALYLTKITDPGAILLLLDHILNSNKLPFDCYEKNTFDLRILMTYRHVSFVALQLLVFLVDDKIRARTTVTTVLALSTVSNLYFLYLE